MSPLRIGVALAVVTALGCGGGGGRTPDSGHDAPSLDASRPDSPNAPVDLGREAVAETGVLDVRSGMDGGLDLRFSMDGGLDLGLSMDGGQDLGGSIEIADAPTQDVGLPAIDGAALDGGPRLDPCDPAAIITLPLVGAGTATETGVLLGSSHQRPQTPGCTEGATGPEVVYGLDLPAGDFHLSAATVSPAGTTTDTVLYLQTACGAGMELACNDDRNLPQGPSAIATAVTGPRRLYLVVDSFKASPSSPANAFGLTVTLSVPASAGAPCAPVASGALDPCASGFVCPPSAGRSATCTSPTAPVIDTAELFPQLGQPATETTLYLSAHDGQGDWKNLHLVFKDGTGAVLEEQDVDLAIAWGQAALLQMPFALTLATGTASVDVAVTDSTSLGSGVVNARLTPWSGLGQSCNAALVAPDPCQGDLVCVNATCSASAAATTACSQAPAITFGSEIRGTAAELVSDTFEGSCYYQRGGNDKVYRAVLPAPAGGALAWDLVAATANSSVPWDYRAQLDTYLYLRTTCTDPRTESQCSDDVTDKDLRSQLAAMNLGPGTYYLYLDTSSPSENGAALSYSFVVQARPVLPPGASCDPTGVANRCQASGCSAVTAACP
jgi:hypothetical protein